MRRIFVPTLACVSRPCFVLFAAISGAPDRLLPSFATCSSPQRPASTIVVTRLVRKRVTILRSLFRIGSVAPDRRAVHGAAVGVVAAIIVTCERTTCSIPRFRAVVLCALSAPCLVCLQHLCGRAVSLRARAAPRGTRLEHLGGRAVGCFPRTARFRVHAGNGFLCRCAVRPRHSCGRQCCFEFPKTFKVRG